MKTNREVGTTLTQLHPRIIVSGSAATATGVARFSLATAAGSVVVPTTTIRTEYLWKSTPHARARDGRAEQLGTLRETVSSLLRRVRALEEELRPTVVIVREVPRERARQLLLDYFKANPDSYPSDAAMALSLDSAFVRDLCSELIEEGLLGG